MQNKYQSSTVKQTKSITAFLNANNKQKKD